MSRLTEDLEREIEELKAEVKRGQAREAAKDAEIARLIARCNRMVRSAAIEDIHAGRRA